MKFWGINKCRFTRWLHAENVPALVMYLFCPEWYAQRRPMLTLPPHASLRHFARDKLQANQFSHLLPLPVWHVAKIRTTTNRSKCQWEVRRGPRGSSHEKFHAAPSKKQARFLEGPLPFRIIGKVTFLEAPFSSKKVLRGTFPGLPPFAPLLGSIDCGKC